MNGQPNAHVMKRTQKANMILQTCKKAFDSDLEDTGVDAEKIVSLVSLEFGAGHRYVMEIVKDLVNAGQLNLVDKKLYYVDNSKSS